MFINREIDAFVDHFVEALATNSAAIFAGAGMSKAAGAVDWAELLTDIAKELGLEIDKEQDLISLAQYHVNARDSRARVTQKIINEFVEDVDLTENHRTVARLPISTYWTTNYDRLIEKALEEANRRPDVKFKVAQIFNTRPKRDAVVYKMHGDADNADEATLTKEDYENYHIENEAFINALTGDLTTKTFLFIGFSFTDPNLDYVLSRINVRHHRHRRDHYFFVRRPKIGEKGNEDQVDFDYNTRKHQLRIRELKRYGIQALEINEYPEIEAILQEIENRFRKRTIFISGSAEEYGDWKQLEAQKFIHKLSKDIVIQNYRIVNGFGWGVGSAVINGALDAIYERPDRYSEDQLIMKPFPQFKTGGKELPELWEEYRQRMIKFAGIAIFVFGNKKDEDGNNKLADGIKREFEIARQHGVVPIPVPATGYMAKEIFDEISKDFKTVYAGNESIIPLVEELSKYNHEDAEEIVYRVIQIIRGVNK